jgi:type I restriction enzyme S subunit
VPLGEVISHRNQFLQIDDLEDYRRCRIQLHARGIVLRDSLPGALIKTKKQQVCRAGEFLIAEIDAKVGGYGIVPDTLDGAVVSSHYFLFTIDEARIDRRFLAYFVRTAEFAHQVAARGSTNYASIRPDHVLRYQVPLPPFHEQRRIVAKIDAIATEVGAAKELKDRTLADTNGFWKALSRVARNTRHATRRLSEVADFLDGQRVPLSRAERAGRQGPYPYYGASGVIDWIDGYLFDEPLVLLSEDGANLIRRSTPIAFIAKGKYWVNNHAHVLRPRCGVVDIRFLCYALSDYDVSGLNFASAQAKLNQRNAAAISLPIPPLEEQLRIAAHLDRLEAKVDGLRRLQAKTAADLDALMPSVLDKAFKGELV